MSVHRRRALLAGKGNCHRRTGLPPPQNPDRHITLENHVVGKQGRQPQFRPGTREETQKEKNRFFNHRSDLADGISGDDIAKLECGVFRRSDLGVEIHMNEP